MPYVHTYPCGHTFESVDERYPTSCKICAYTATGASPLPVGAAPTIAGGEGGKDRGGAGGAPVSGPRPVDPAAHLLDRAKSIVTGARRQSYGTPEDNFATIAEYWNVHLNRRRKVTGNEHYQLTASDIADMMILVKLARLAETPQHVDSALDIGGYAGCKHRIQVSEGADLA